MDEKLMEQIARISKYGFILNCVDNLQCVIENEKHSIHLLLYENEKPVLEEILENIRDKSSDFIYQEINMLCDKLQLYRKKYKI